MQGGASTAAVQDHDVRSIVHERLPIHKSTRSEFPQINGVIDAIVLETLRWRKPVDSWHLRVLRDHLQRLAQRGAAGGELVLRQARVDDEHIGRRAGRHGRLQRVLQRAVVGEQLRGKVLIGHRLRDSRLPRGGQQGTTAMCFLRAAIPAWSVVDLMSCTQDRDLAKRVSYGQQLARPVSSNEQFCGKSPCCDIIREHGRQQAVPGRN